MVKSGDGSGGSPAIAPFLKKCYDMVDEESTNSIVSWSPSNDSFIIWDMTEFSVKLLPEYFKHSNSSSFVRQLNIYGFRKIDPDRWEFANDGFVKGEKHLLKNISRRKNPQGSSNQKSVAEQHAVEVEKVDLCKEIENLKIDRNAVTQELVKLRQHQETADKKLLLLRDRLKGMETNQEQMLSFLVLVMQHPGFVVQLLNPKENGWRMAEPGSIIEQGADENESLVSDGRIVRYQPTTDNVDTRMNDFSISPDFMKLLSEETFATENNHSPFVMPEIHEGTSWEQLLLGTCSSVNNPEIKSDGEEADDDCELEMGRTLPNTLMDAELLEEQMEEFMRVEGVHLEE
ncbi:unnamed protein product [Linum tenue]|uniref:HSF-type DNA-binding domain-containing protein n=1 Tax=Linum tenue TaxID=586396 RepID=A0AAV0LCS9_9ROSI|nr:unnamed protein product [Linum tenue]